MITGHDPQANRPARRMRDCGPQRAHPQLHSQGLPLQMLPGQYPDAPVAHDASRGGETCMSGYGDAVVRQPGSVTVAARGGLEAAVQPARTAPEGEFGIALDPCLHATWARHPPENNHRVLV